MQPINATIKEIDGRIGIDIKDKAYFENYLRKVGVGNGCSVQIDKPVIPGTQEQNRFMHSLLNEYFKTGMHSLPEVFRSCPDGLKAWYKERFLSSNKAPSSWSRYNKGQRMAFIDMILSDIKQSEALQESRKLQEIIQGAENAGFYGLDQ